MKPPDPAATPDPASAAPPAPAPATPAPAALAPADPAAAAPEPEATAVAPEPAPAECPRWARASFLRITERPDRHQRRERLVGLLELPAEHRAALARAQVAADQRARTAAEPFGHFAQFDADLVTGQQAGLGCLGQRHPCANEQRLHARHGRLHRLGDLLIGERVHLAQHERRFLRLGHFVDIPDQQPELLALVDLVGGAGAVVGVVQVHRVDADRLDPAQVVEAAVAGDPVQPRSDVDRAIVGQDRVEGGRHHLLHHVLCVLAASEQMPAEGEQPHLVARQQHLERGHVALAQISDQPLIRLEPQQRGTPMQADPPGIFQRRDFHPGRSAKTHLSNRCGHRSSAKVALA